LIVDIVQKTTLKVTKRHVKPPQTLKRAQKP